jgi:hypothetical protein
MYGKVPDCDGWTVNVGRPGPAGIQGAEGGPGEGAGVGGAETPVASDDPPHPVSVAAIAVDVRNRNSRRFTAFRR